MASQLLPPQVSPNPLQFQEPSQTPTVLLVDTDPDCIDHCKNMLDDLSYPNVGVGSAREALDFLARDPNVEIVVANAVMPMVDGFMLIEEARARIGATRPLAFVATTDRITTELAVRGLHHEAVDLLCKPLGFEEWSLALRRANRYLAARRKDTGNATISAFSQQLSQLVAMLETGGPQQGERSQASDTEIAATLRSIIGARALRNRFFPSQIFADPAWDILLDLTRAKLESQQVSVSSVCIAASVPMSTALRWVKQMTDANLLRRWTDPNDRRRDLIALTDPTAERMREYLALVHKSFSAL